jgi:TPR repeat protein
MKALLLALAMALAVSEPAAEPTHQDAKPLAQAQAAVDKGRWLEARRRLQPLAAKGNPLAMWALARLLELPTPARDLKLALHWYTRLAEQGVPDAMEAAGLAYFLGRGVPEDLSLAAEWFRRAGNAGAVGSQFILASLYEKGQGVPQDLRLARSWYERAAAQGDEAAKAKLQVLPQEPLTTPL